VNHISEAISKYNNKSGGFPLRKASSFLWAVKDDLHLKILGKYNIFCLCCQVYNRWTNHSFETGVEEQQWHMYLYHLDKSVMEGYSINVGHYIQLQNDRIVSTKYEYTLIRKEIRLSSISIIL
jgi:hypothetical protein